MNKQSSAKKEIDRNEERRKKENERKKECSYWFGWIFAMQQVAIWKGQKRNIYIVEWKYKSNRPSAKENETTEEK